MRLRDLISCVVVLVVTGCSSSPKSTKGYYYAGPPVSSEQYTVLTNKGYVVAYDEKTKSPVWVCYRLFRVSSLEAPERPSGFRVDKRTRSRVSSDQYTHSGYDRGHMAPNYGIAICYGEEAQKETFLMSNVTPQTPELNRGPWKILEQRIAKEWVQTYGNAWVVTGPIQGPELKVIGDGIKVPSSFYKIVVFEENGQPKIRAFTMRQTILRTADPSNYMSCVDFVEKVTGLVFFSELPDELEEELEKEHSKGGIQ